MVDSICKVFKIQKKVHQDKLFCALKQIFSSLSSGQDTNSIQTIFKQLIKVGMLSFDFIQAKTLCDSPEYQFYEL